MKAAPDAAGPRPRRGAAPIDALWSRLAEWHAAAASWVGALRAYARELDAENRKTLGELGHWGEARVAVEDAAVALVARLVELGAAPPAPFVPPPGASGRREPAPDARADRPWPIKWPRGAPKAALESLGSLPPRSAAAAEDFSRLIGLGDALERLGREVSAAAGGLTDPAVRAAATAGMSRSYEEDLLDLARLISVSADRVRHLQASAVRRAAAAGAAFAGLPAEAIAGAFDEGSGRHGGVATELYLGALTCAARAAGAEWARARLSDAATQAFGIARDSLDAVAADARSLGEYHPVQAMLSAPGPAPRVASALGPGAPAGRSSAGPAPLDLTLPGSKLAIVYDLARLTDRQRALEFGPLVSSTAGLDLRLVERLRSIRECPAAAGTAQAAPETRPNAEATSGGRVLVVPAGEPLPITTNSGASVSSEVRSQPWAPLAGGPPRELRRAMASEAVILEAIRAERRAGWSLDLRVRFEGAVLDARLPGSPGADAIVAGLVACLDAAYSAAPPAGPEEFYELAVGRRFDPGGVVAEAVSRAGWAAYADRVQAEIAAIGAPRVPIPTLARETRAAGAAAALEAAQDLWKRLRAPLAVSDPAADALPEPQRKLARLAAFRRAAERALAAEPVDCAPVTPAFFAATANRMPNTPEPT